MSFESRQLEIAPQQSSSLSAVYSALNWRDAQALLTNPAQAADLYKANRHVLDTDGNGKIDKKELLSTITDPYSSTEARKIAGAFLAGYEHLARVRQYENPILGALPLNEKFQPTKDTRPGIGEDEVKALRLAQIRSERQSDQWWEAFKTGSLVAGGALLAYLAFKLPKAITTKATDYSLNGIFGQVLPYRKAIYEAAREEGLTAVLAATPIAIGTGLVGGAGRYAADSMRLSNERSTIDQMLDHISKRAK